MTGALAGRTIVVTRPAAQAGRFIELAQAAGAQCVAFPTIAIESLPVDAAERERVLRTAWDWAIYTSTNAVDGGLAAFGILPGRRRAAVGRATARALERHGASVDLRPDTATSEGLLAAPELAAPAGEHILLVKGSGGRDLLRETLTARGAHVAAVEVYRRTRAQPQATAVAQLTAALAEPTRLVVAVTSAEVLEALLQLVDAGTSAALRRTTLLVPGSRVATAAASAGWEGRVLQAATAEDDAMIRALQDAGASHPA